MTDPLVVALHHHVAALASRVVALECRAYGARASQLPPLDVVSLPLPLRDSMAPSPDYAITEAERPLRDPELCGCDESTALRAQLASLRAELDALETHHEIERQARKRADLEVERLIHALAAAEFAQRRLTP